MTQKSQINVRGRRVRHYVKENNRITSLDVHRGPYMKIFREVGKHNTRRKPVANSYLGYQQIQVPGCSLDTKNEQMKKS